LFRTEDEYVNRNKKPQKRANAPYNKLNKNKKTNKYIKFFIYLLEDVV